MLTEAQHIVLRHVAVARPHIQLVSESFRQTVIDLGMMEPPLVDIGGDFLLITPAGRAALSGHRPKEDR